MTTTINSNFELQYIPARIVDGNDLYVIYYAWHPIEKKNKRKVIRLNHLKKKMNKTQLIRYARKIAHDVNENLAAGKNPFIEADMPKSYSKLTDAIELFLKIKKKEMRIDGFRSYTSYAKRLTDWMISRKIDDCYVITFSIDLAIELMNEIAINEKLGNRTWNNHFVFYRSLWNWLIENNYCKENAFGKFKKKREEEKIRKVIPDKVHADIMEWCRQYNPKFEIIIDLVRASFIRPSEICKIRIGDIDVFNKVIKIPESQSKTHNFRFAYLPDWLVAKIVVHYQLDRFPLSYLLVSKQLEPGVIEWNTRKLDKIWEKLRDKLELGKDMQLYSYRDTGITFLENKGVPRNVIQKLTDHKSERMVGKYIGKPSQELIDNVVCKITE